MLALPSNLVGLLEVGANVSSLDGPVVGGSNGVGVGCVDGCLDNGLLDGLSEGELVVGGKVGSNGSIVGFTVGDSVVGSEEGSLVNGSLLGD